MGSSNATNLSFNESDAVENLLSSDFMSYVYNSSRPFFSLGGSWL
jgi:hypothetical protein